MFNKTLINFRPFFFGAICIALEIGSGYMFYFANVLWGVLLAVICLLFVLFTILFSGGEIKSKIIFGIVFILIFSVGAGVFFYQVKEFDEANLDGHYYIVSGKVSNASQTDYGQKLTLKDVSIKGDRTGELRYGVALYVYNENEGEVTANFDIGDVLNFESYLQDIGAIYEDKLSATNIERGVKYTATVQLSNISKTTTDLTLFEKIHIFLRDTIKNGMGEQESAVAYGLLLGNTDEMDDEVITSYRSAGVAHIFAVSGLHIGFLATALNFIFNKLKINRLVKAIIITSALFFYSGICGFSASSLRASVMSAVLLFSSIKGNRYDGLSSVGLACALILICSPIHMFCVGFQLSFVVVLGIILLSPPLTRLLSFMPNKLASSVSTVVCAQVVGIPICLYAFSQFSIISILANLIFIPIVGAVYIFLFIATLIGGTFGISSITLYLPNYIFLAINTVITAIDYELFIVGGFTFSFFVIFYYFALVTPSGIIKLNRISKTIVCLVLVVACAVGTTLFSIKENSAPKVFVLGNEMACATVIKMGEETTMIISDADKNFSLNTFNRLAKKQTLTEINTLIFTQGDEDIQLVLTRLNQTFKFEKVFYYGETNNLLEDVLRKSFDVTVRSFLDGEYFPILTSCSYMLGGYAIELSINGYDLVVFSEFGNDNAGYKGLEGEYDYIVATDYSQFIKSEYNPKEFISYKESGEFKSALRNGTIALNLK